MSSLTLDQSSRDALADRLLVDAVVVAQDSIRAGRPGYARFKLARALLAAERLSPATPSVAPPTVPTGATPW